MELIIYVIVCILQPICWPLPEMTTIVYGTMKFGANKAFIIGYVSILIGIVFMYKITNYFSDKYLAKIKSKSNFKKYQKYIINNQIVTTGLLFILPILPDEIICIGSAIIGIEFKFFLIIAIFSKFISIGIFAYSEQISKVIGISQPTIIIIELIVIFIIASIYKKRGINRNETV